MSEPAPARLVPGAVLLGRYRIVAPLGRGGMGEVLRADDLKLGQPVALKFLPPRLARDPAWLARFHGEVRVARQVSHPNVCRVHDIGEVDGEHFISMEYVDGEDLASLLRRIGRFPQERGALIATQLAAGLAAAHAQGVLHRDLKPANVMIDGRGRVRLTDFGLAGLAGSFAAGDLASGTPAYMAPEQFEGREVSVKSDLYAMGLVLYELFTGCRAIEGTSLAEVAAAHRERVPPPPALLVDGLDPRVDAAIRSCLERDPARRPASALAVMAALPGGDPVAAAIAAGETPSPAMVAAAGGSGVLERGRARLLFASVLLGLSFVYGLTFGLHLGIPQRIRLPHAPEVLADRAEVMLRRLGWEVGRGRAWGLDYDGPASSFVMRRPDPAMREALLGANRPATIRFWYRRGPRPFEARNVLGRVTPHDPALAQPGSVLAELDAEGRLVALRGLAPGDRAPIEGEPEWGAVLQAAGLDRASLSPAPPQGLPTFFADARAGWEGRFPEAPELPIRVEAAAYRGLPVHFELRGPWSPAEPRAADAIGRGLQLWQMLLAVLVVGAALLARHNLRLGRGDARGALRLAMFACGLRFLEWLFAASHVGSAISEVRLFNRGVAWSLFTGGAIGVLYLALEPYVRRLWPDTLVSWTRLLRGGWRDPLVGRDLLLGMLSSVSFIVVGALSYLTPLAFGRPQRISAHAALDTLAGGRFLAADLAGGLLFALQVALLYLFLLTGLHLALRLRSLAVATYVAVLAASQVGVWSVFFGEVHGVDWIVAVLHSLVVMLVVTRFGLVAAVALLLPPALALRFPAVVFDPAHWTAPVLLLPMVVFFAVAVHGYRACLGPKRGLSGPKG